jgi:hypothetical protein
MLGAPTVTHLLNRQIAVWRNSRTPDGAGGWVTERVFSHDLDVRVSRARINETRIVRSQIGPMQAEARVTHIVYADADADLLRGDELRDNTYGETYRVIGTQRATGPDVYVRAEAELLQAEPTNQAEES